MKAFTLLYLGNSFSEFTIPYDDSRHDLSFSVVLAKALILCGQHDGPCRRFEVFFDGGKTAMDFDSPTAKTF